MVTRSQYHPAAVLLGTVTATWKDVAVTAVGAPNVAPGTVLLRVRPASNPVPVTVATVVVPLTSGVIDVTVGPGFTVRQPEHVAEPPAVVSTSETGPLAEPAAREADTLNCVEFLSLTEVTVSPGLEKLTVACDVNPVPVTLKVTGVLPVSGGLRGGAVVEATVGAGAAVTLRQRLHFATPPSGLVTVTLCPPGVTVGATVTEKVSACCDVYVH